MGRWYMELTTRIVCCYYYCFKKHVSAVLLLHWNWRLCSHVKLSHDRAVGVACSPGMAQWSVWWRYHCDSCYIHPTHQTWHAMTSSYFVIRRSCSGMTMRSNRLMSADSCLESMPSEFCLTGIRNLFDKYNICIAVKAIMLNNSIKFLLVSLVHQCKTFWLLLSLVVHTCSCICTGDTLQNII